MGRQYRPPRRGPDSPAGLHGMSHMNQATPAITSSSSTAIAIPNYGYTNIGSYTAGEYVLDSPDAGVVKTLVCVSSSSLARVIRFSTAGTVTAGTLAGTTGATGGTQITFNATVDQCVMLLGINSTHWAILATYPPTAANSTGIVLAAT